VSVVNAHGAGTIAKIVSEIAAFDLRHRSSKENQSSAPQSSNQDSRKLMVVDDEIEVCNFVKMFFEQRGFRVLRAHDALEAVSIARQNQPHVILMDVGMKESDDGITALPKIREVAPQARVIMTTAVDDEISMARAKSLGAVDYITKPLVLEDLETAVIRQVEEMTG